MLKPTDLLRRLLLSFIAALALTAQAGAYDDVLIATRNGDVDTVRHLVARGMDVNTIDPDGNTLLMLAVIHNNPALAEVLLQARASLNKVNPLGETALALAAFGGHEALVKRLLEAGADPDSGGWKALHYAAYQGQTAIARVLLTAGAKPDLRAPNQQTALMLAARNGHQGVAEALLAAGADPAVKDGDGHVAAEIAEDYRQTDLAAVLRSRTR